MNSQPINQRAKAFFDLVVELRKEQKEYFKTRSSVALSKSKALEKRVDDEIERANMIMAQRKESEQARQQSLWEKK